MQLAAYFVLNPSLKVLREWRWADQWVLKEGRESHTLSGTLFHALQLRSDS